MHPRQSSLLLFALSVCVLGFGVEIARGQAQAGKPVGDGLLRSELSLSGRTATIAYAPNLKISPVSGSTKARDLVGQLEITGPLRIGTTDLFVSGAPPNAAETPGAANQPPPVSRFALWLESSASASVLQIVDGSQKAVGDVALDRQPAPSAPPGLVAALMAESFTSARFVLRWGAFEATAPVEFVDPLRRRPTETPAPNQTINRRHDEDTSVLSRARLLAQRNETALTGPKGARVSISFQRSFASTVPRTARTRGLAVDRPDFKNLATTPAGSFVLLTESPVPRLRTEVPLRFGKTSIAIGNQVVGFPGSYGLWLKRVSSGWRLVFNHEPDAWGSQHNPKFDAAEIDLAHSDGHDAGRPFAVNLIPDGPERGRLQIVWGPHEWTADFSY